MGRPAVCTDLSGPVRDLTRCPLWGCERRGTPTLVKGLRGSRRFLANMLLNLLNLLNLLTLSTLAGEVSVDPDTVLLLQPAGLEAPTPPGPRVVRRDVVLVQVEGGVELTASWILDTEASGWFEGDLALPGLHLSSLTWLGESIDSPSTLVSSALTVALSVQERGELVLKAFAPGDLAVAPIALGLLPAPLGTVEVGSLEVADAVHVDGVAWTGERRLVIREPMPPPAGQETLAVGHGGLGLTVGEGAIAAHARLVWELRRGELEQVSFRLGGAGRDLQVTGAGVRDWTRSGDRIQVTLQEPQAGRVVLDATWSTAIPNKTDARVAVPSIGLDGAFRTDFSVQLARDGELEVLPELTRWQPVAAASLPTWGRGLVEGAPSAAYVATRAHPGELTLLRFEPVAGPPVLVDVAAHTIALTDEGRAMMRSLYQVRNERAGTLRIVPPEGSELLGVRVGPHVATPTSDGEPGILVPLLRSVETVQGLLSFPVEVLWLRQDLPWQPGTRRGLALPTVDAPVGVERITVHLPIGYRSRMEPGEDGVVEAFSEGQGITYGFGVGDTQAMVADDLFQEAVQAWMGNDFNEAQAQLDALRTLGAEHQDIERLQSNLDLLLEEPESKTTKSKEKATERRVREQARARSAGKARAQKQAAMEASEAERRGDYEQAEELYLAAVELGVELEMLEQEESVEQSELNVAFGAGLKRAQENLVASEPSAEGWWESEVSQEPLQMLDFVEEPVDWLEEAEGRSAVMLWGQVVGDEESGVLYGEGHGSSGSGSGWGGMGGIGSVDSGSGGGGTGDSAPAPEAGSYGSSSAGKLSEMDFATPRTSSRRRRGLLLDRKSTEFLMAEDEAWTPSRAVTASALSVTIPAVGEAVHYQRLLLPAGASSEVLLEARQPRSSWRSR